MPASGDLFGRTPPSLRRRLLQLISLATLATWLVAGSLSYRQARHEVGEMMDAHMAQTGGLLLAQAIEMPELLSKLPALLATRNGVEHKYLKGLTMELQITRSDGTIVARSPESPAVAIAGDDGYSRVKVEGRSWRSFVLTAPAGGLRIQVLQQQSLRNEEALEIAVKTVAPLGVMIPVLLLLIYLAVRRGLQPLEAITAEVALRSPENLQAVSTTAVPAEVTPLVSALNRLLSRLGLSLDNERRFTADAAHELRTPLAAIRVQAQVALASTDSEAHRHALNQVVAGTQRATRLVEQLLRLARLDPLATLPDAVPLDLNRVAGDILAELLAGMPRRTDDVQLDTASSAHRVAGDAQLLGVALRNLIENALRYTAPGQAITVFVGEDNGETVFGVRDAGSGVPAEDLPKLIERFYRGKDNTSEGSGLGLAIVRRIAQLHGAHLEVGNIDGGGFLAQLRWDPVSPALATATTSR